MRCTPNPICYQTDGCRPGTAGVVAEPFGEAETVTAPASIRDSTVASTVTRPAAAAVDLDHLRIEFANPGEAQLDYAITNHGEEAVRAVTITWRVFAEGSPTPLVLDTIFETWSHIEGALRPGETRPLGLVAAVKSSTSLRRIEATISSVEYASGRRLTGPGADALLALDCNRQSAASVYAAALDLHGAKGPKALTRAIEKRTLKTSAKGPGVEMAYYILYSLLETVGPEGAARHVRQLDLNRSR
jgi:hypothetical protein